VVSQRERDVAEIDAIIADIDHGPHVATIVPAPDARNRVLMKGEGPVYSFREAAARAFVERRRAGDSDAKVFVDGKPFAPGSRELRKAGAERHEIRQWIGEVTTVAKKQKKAAKKGTKGASKKATGEKKRDPRLPKTGSTLTGKYKGKTYTAKVTADGILYRGKTFKSVSAVGTAITGKACNGYVFFNLNEKKTPAKKKAKRKKK
jgi:hypothetical protein